MSDLIALADQRLAHRKWTCHTRLSSRRFDRPPQQLSAALMPVLWPAASYTMPRMEVKQARRRSPGPGLGACWSAEAVAGAAQLACVLEASAEKPGNITPRHDFADTSYEDMLRSAIALGPELGRGGGARRR